MDVQANFTQFNNISFFEISLYGLRKFWKFLVFQYIYIYIGLIWSNYDFASSSLAPPSWSGSSSKC